MPQTRIPRGKCLDKHNKISSDENCSKKAAVAGTGQISCGRPTNMVSSINVDQEKQVKETMSPPSSTNVVKNEMMSNKIVKKREPSTERHKRNKKQEGSLEKQPTTNSNFLIKSTAASKPTSKNKVGADRRGISEIKRSEAYLQVEVNDLKLKLTAAEMAINKKDVKLSELGTSVERLEGDVTGLRQGKRRLEEAVERANINPVALLPFQQSDDFEQEMKTQEEAEVSEVEKMLAELNDMEESVDGCLRQLTALPSVVVCA